MRTGRYDRVAKLYATASITVDSHRGSTENFAQFGTWRCAAKDVPAVRDEENSTVLHVLEGLWRQDIWDRFNGGKTVRIVVDGMTLKALALENPVPRFRILKVHAAKVTKS